MRRCLKDNIAPKRLRDLVCIGERDCSCTLCQRLKYVHGFIRATAKKYFLHSSFHLQGLGWVLAFYRGLNVREVLHPSLGPLEFSPHIDSREP